jgi:hypothetical protein
MRDRVQMPGGPRSSITRWYTAAFAAALIALAGLQVQAQEPPNVITQGNVRFLHWPENEALARALAGTVRPLPVLPPDILDRPPPIEVRLAPDEAQFSQLTGGRAPDWGAGVAFPESGIIVLPAYGSDRGAAHTLDQVLRHELAHVGLQRFVGGARVPRWFSEGYATWAAGQLDPDAGWFLRLAFITGRAPPLDSLILGWPVGAIDARVAYLLSASAVQWLHAQGGDRVFGIFMEEWRGSSDFEGALRQVYGLSIATFERDWSRSVRRRYGWLLFLAQTAVIWTLIGTLLIVLVIVRRRRDAARMERLVANEIPDRPAYWLETDTAPDESAGETPSGTAAVPGDPLPPTADDGSDPMR